LDNHEIDIESLIKFMERVGKYAKSRIASKIETISKKKKKDRDAYKITRKRTE